MKQNDYFLNVVSNPDFNNADFSVVGLDSSNTSLESKDVYKNLEYVQNLEMFKTDGTFDPNKFDDFYNAVSIRYNELATLDTAKLLAKNLSASKYNIFAEYKDEGPEFYIQKTYLNPTRQKSSISGSNQLSEQTLSAREIAQTQLIDDEGNWQESPNDLGFFGDFFDTKVLATYDSDGTHKDPMTGQMVEHKKGDYKYNYNGTFYYESLGNRDIYGKQVLSKWDVLTTDGSVANKFDFMDSDDLDKNDLGALVKTIVKVVPAFVEQISPWYLGARIALNASDFFIKGAKMAIGNDSPKLSAIEGFLASFSTSISDDASKNLWSLENLINMGADVFLQLAEQRWIFSHLPSMIQGNELGYSKKAQDAWRTKTQNDYLNYYKNLRQYSDNTTSVFWNEAALQAKALRETNAALEKILKSNYQLGAELSKLYMTGVTSSSVYAEAIQQGADKEEAALFTLGFAIGEYGILSTRLGNWILPELQLEKARLRQAILKLHGLEKGISKEQSLSWAGRVIQAGKDWFKGNDLADESVTSAVFKHSVANALGEGTEEVVEQAWLDMSRVLFSYVNTLNGSNVNYRPSWINSEGKFDLAKSLNEYALNFVGGAIGGGLGNLLPSYRSARDIAKIESQQQAYQELVHHIKENGTHDIKKITKSLLLGSPLKSNTILNKFTFADGTESDNQDIAAKKVFFEYLDQIESLINMERNVKTDSELSYDLVFKDIRFSKLLESETLQNVLTNYNKEVSELTQLLIDAQAYSKIDNLTDEQKKDLADLEKKIKEKREIIESYTDGTEGKEFVLDAIFEMEHNLATGYMPTNFVQYVEMKDRSLGNDRNLEEIPKETLQKYKEEWARNPSFADQIRSRRKWFDAVNKKVSTSLDNFIQEYLNDVKTFVGKSTDMVQDKINDSLNSKEILADPQNLSDFLRQIYSDQTPDIIFDTNYSKRVSLLGSLINTGMSVNPDKFEKWQTLYRQLRHTESMNSMSVVHEDNTTEYLNPEQLINYVKSNVNRYIDYDINGPTNDPKTIAQNLVNNHNQIFDRLATTILADNDTLDLLESELSKEQFLAHSARSYLKEFLQTYLKHPNILPEYKDKLSNKYDHFVKLIDSFKHTPIQNLLDKLQLILEDPSLKFSELIQALEREAYKESRNGTLSDFGYPNTTWESAIKSAEDLYRIIYSHLIAGRTDSADPLSAFSYNYTVNYLNKSDDLVTYNEDGFNILFDDLNKQLFELSSYKLLVANSAKQLISKQNIVSTRLLFNVAEKFSRYFKPTVEKQEWEGFKEFANELADLTKNDSELSKLKSVDKIFTDLEQFKLRQLEFQLKQAIFNFVQKNKSKSADEFAKLFLELIPENEFTITDNIEDYADSDSVDYKVAFSYFASAGSLSYAEFLNSYKDEIARFSMFVPTDAARNLLFHETSFVTKKEIWDKIQHAYNALQERALLTDLAIPTTTNFKNASDSKHNNHSHLNFKDCFLAQGYAGTGKSSSNLSILLSILKNTKGITDKIALVHKTEQQAKELRDVLIRFTGLSEDNFMIFDHKSYFNYINPNIPKPIITKSGITYDKSQLTQNDETQLWSFNEEKNINESGVAPTLVIMDEQTNVDNLNMSVHQYYINKKGIRSITLGDFHQSTLKGTINLGDVNEILSNHAHNFMATWNMVTSFRSTSKFNSDNQLEILNYRRNWLSAYNLIAEDVGLGNPIPVMQSTEDLDFDYGLEQIQTKYTHNDYSFDGTYIYDPDKLNNEITDEVKSMIDTMIRTTSDKILVLYQDQNHPLYKYCKTLDQQDKFEYVEGVAQGRESDYAIVALNNVDVAQIDVHSDETQLFETLIQDLYTAISRPRIGSIISQLDWGNDDSSKKIFKESVKEESAIKTIFTDEFKQYLISQELRIIEQLLKDVQVGQITTDYEIKTPQIKGTVITDIDKLRKHITDLENEILKNPDSVSIELSEYNQWLSVAKDNKDQDLLDRINKLRNYVNIDRDKDFHDPSQQEDGFRLKNNDLTKVQGPLYTFNAYALNINIIPPKNDTENERVEIVSKYNNGKSTLPSVKKGDFNDDGVRIPSATEPIVGMAGLRNLKKLYDEGYLEYGKSTINNPNDLLDIIYKLYYAIQYNDDEILNDFEDNYGVQIVLGFTNTDKSNNLSKLIEQNISAPLHRISAFLISKNGDKIAELPMYTLPNVTSLFESYNLDQSLLDELNRLAVKEDTNRFQDMLNLLNDRKSEAKALIKLLQIFVNTTSQSYYLIKNASDQYIWTTDINLAIKNRIRSISGTVLNGKRTGINVISSDKTSNGYLDYISESTLATDSINFGDNYKPVYGHSEIFAFGNDYSIDITYGQETVTKVIEAGKAFIFVSQNSDFVANNAAFNDMMENVKKGLVQIVYVNTPTIFDKNNSDTLKTSQMTSVIEEFIKDKTSIQSLVSIHNLAKVLKKVYDGLSDEHKNNFANTYISILNSTLSELDTLLQEYNKSDKTSTHPLRRGIDSTKYGDRQGWVKSGTNHNLFLTYGGLLRYVNQKLLLNLGKGKEFTDSVKSMLETFKGSVIQELISNSDTYPIYRSFERVGDLEMYNGEVSYYVLRSIYNNGEFSAIYENGQTSPIYINGKLETSSELGDFSIILQLIDDKTGGFVQQTTVPQENLKQVQKVSGQPIYLYNGEYYYYNNGKYYKIDDFKGQNFTVESSQNIPFEIGSNKAILTNWFNTNDAKKLVLSIGEDFFVKKYFNQYSLDADMTATYGTNIYKFNDEYYTFDQNTYEMKSYKIESKNESDGDNTPLLSPEDIIKITKHLDNIEDTTELENVLNTLMKRGKEDKLPTTEAINSYNTMFEKCEISPFVTPSNNTDYTKDQKEIYSQIMVELDPIFDEMFEKLC